VEYLLQVPSKHQLHAPNENHRVRRRSDSFKKRKTVIVAENFANIELTKISTSVNANKFHFNEQKSKTMLLSRIKRKDCKDLEIYLNFRPLTQVLSLKYLGIILDTKHTFRQHINYITEKVLN
jgi:hypothetical protein